MELTAFDIGSFFVRDTNKLREAREAGRSIHATKDIDAAGDEVEIPIRDVLRSRLSRKFYVGHGHIVDSTLKTSPQLDVIIADDANTPVLWKAQNGMEYMPFESVYAIGEAKATYRKGKKPIQEFSQKLAAIQGGLKRNMVKTAPTVGMNDEGTWMHIRRNTLGLNPLYSFMLFADAGDFDINDLREHYGTTPLEHLPVMVCLLNKGVIALGSFNKDRTVRTLVYNPTTSTPQPDEDRIWVGMTQSGTWDFQSEGMPLAWLISSLFMSLGEAVLEHPPMNLYLNNFLYKCRVEFR